MRRVPPQVPVLCVELLHCCPPTRLASGDQKKLEVCAGSDMFRLQTVNTYLSGTCQHLRRLVGIPLSPPVAGASPAPETPSLLPSDPGGKRGRRKTGGVCRGRMFALFTRTSWVRVNTDRYRLLIFDFFGLVVLLFVPVRCRCWSCAWHFFILSSDRAGGQGMCTLCGAVNGVL